MLKKNSYDPNLKSALYIGRFQPFHNGHFYIFKKLLKENDNVIIGLINRPKDEKNPFSKRQVKAFINKKLVKFKGKYKIFDLGNIYSFNYGRKVGYKIQRITVPKKIELISSTKIRKKIIK